MSKTLHGSWIWRIALSVITSYDLNKYTNSPQRLFQTRILRILFKLKGKKPRKKRNQKVWQQMLLPFWVPSFFALFYFRIRTPLARIFLVRKYLWNLWCRRKKTSKGDLLDFFQNPNAIILFWINKVSGWFIWANFLQTRCQWKKPTVMCDWWFSLVHLESQGETLRRKLYIGLQGCTCEVLLTKYFNTEILHCIKIIFKTWRLPEECRSWLLS